MLDPLDTHPWPNFETELVGVLGYCPDAPNHLTGPSKSHFQFDHPTNARPDFLLSTNPYSKRSWRRRIFLFYFHPYMKILSCINQLIRPDFYKSL